jgi:hypothetical protein
MTVSDKNNDKKAENRLQPAVANTKKVQKEFGGPKGPEPTRYGDWEKKGRCIDF